MVPGAGGGLVELFTGGPASVAETLLFLGYPVYIMKILGLAKVLGGIAILTGRSPRLKEWAYAGFAFDFLGATASTSECAEREVDRWETILRKDELEPQPVLNLAIRWLRRNLPEAQRIALLHGDYRTGNYLFGDDGIHAFLDWEMAHLGDPLEDVGWTAIRYWRFGGTEKVGGVIDREQFHRLYEAAGGARVDRRTVHFWEVLGNLKMAVISVTGARSYSERATHDSVMAYVGRNIPRLEAEILALLD